MVWCAPPQGRKIGHGYGGGGNRPLLRSTHRLAVAVGNVICSFKCVQVPCMIVPSFCLTGAVGTKPQAKIGPGIVRARTKSKRTGGPKLRQRGKTLSTVNWHKKPLVQSLRPPCAATSTPCKQPRLMPSVGLQAGRKGNISISDQGRWPH